MAPQTAAEIDRLEQRGQLQMRAARVTSIRRRAGWLEVMLDRAEEPEALTLSVDAVVNCSGLTGDPTADPLLGGMAARGWCTPDRLGLGLVADDAGCLIDGWGLSSQIATLGPLRRGQLWETTAIPEIRAQAERLALALAAGVRADRRRRAG
jgi:uncharacterized NAD(P)/FAD-binding protein YdhS